MSFVIMFLAIVLGSLAIQKLNQKGLRAGWLALAIISFSAWFLSFIYVLSRWGIR